MKIETPDAMRGARFFALGVGFCELSTGIFGRGVRLDYVRRER
jgi:hypothetical protein